MHGHARERAFAGGRRSKAGRSDGTKRKASGRRWAPREALVGYLFASPVILGLIVWVIGPMIGSALISLTDWNVLSAPHWVGLRNYVRLFTTDLYFRNSLLVTVYFVVLNVILTFVYSLVLALLLNQKIKGQGHLSQRLLPADHRADRGQQRPLAVALQSQFRAVQRDPPGARLCASPSGWPTRPPSFPPSC